MTEYRLYSLDGQGHITAPAEIVDCATDREAMMLAQERAIERIIEVWQGSRRVITVPVGGRNLTLT
jgi:hypothetical protein